MSSINAISLQFHNPWLLLVFVPALALILLPYFLMPKKRRRTRNRIISLVMHCVLVFFCVLLLAGTSLHITQVELKSDVILLVDLSDSNESAREDMDEFILSVLGEGEEGYRFGIITFANGNVYNCELNSDTESVLRSYLREGEKPLGNATDIASALLYARDALSNPNQGRIILLSDGVQTDGNALATVKGLADAGIRVDTVYFSPQSLQREVLINAVEVPQWSNIGESKKISAVIRSTQAGPAVLALYDNGELVAEQEVYLNGGMEAFDFNYTLLTPNLHEFTVTVTANADTLEQNNKYYAYVNVETSTKVLLVDGTGEEAEALGALLEEDFELTRVNLEGIPATLSELRAYDEVILMNVANADLPTGFDGILTQFVNDGGGLYTVGGDKMYRMEDMQGSDYEKLLPVDANIKTKSLGLLLIIDRSSSMGAIATGSTSTRLELAIEGAIASVNELGPDDYVGVITFDANAEILSPMTPVSQKNSIIRRIEGITLGYGTQYFNALYAARNMLQTFNQTDLRHIIFLTDGEPVDATNSFLQLVDLIAQNDITLSTIALGASVSVDIAQEMAQRGNGRFHNVSRESELVRVMVEETTTAADQLENMVTFTPSIVSRTSAVAGIDVLPQLEGYYGTSLKEGATMVLGYEGSPIYAEWTVGKGHVGSFMSDLNGTWSSAYFTEESGIRFIQNTVYSHLPKGTNSSHESMNAEFVRENFTTQLRVTASAAEDATFAAEIISPSGARELFTLEKLNGSLYVCNFRTEEQGLYTVHIIKTDATGTEEMTTYTAFSYSDEYSAFYDETEYFNFMEELSREGNGSMLFSTENLFGRKNEATERDFDLRLIFLIVCAALFLVEIVIRKFKIRSPREIAQEKRDKRRNSES